MGLNEGTRGQKLRRVSGGAVVEPPENTRPTLADVGIDKKLSSRSQAVHRAGPPSTQEKRSGIFRTLPLAAGEMALYGILRRFFERVRPRFGDSRFVGVSSPCRALSRSRVLGGLVEIDVEAIQAALGVDDGQTELKPGARRQA